MSATGVSDCPAVVLTSFAYSVLSLGEGPTVRMGTERGIVRLSFLGYSSRVDKTCPVDNLECTRVFSGRKL